MVGLKSGLKKRGKLITNLEFKESRNEQKIQWKSEADNIQLNSLTSLLTLTVYMFTELLGSIFIIKYSPALFEYSATLYKRADMII